MQPNPIQDFLKYAGSTKVKSHTRRTSSGVISIKQHDRDVDDKEPLKTEGTLEGHEHPELRLDDKKLRELQLWEAWKANGQRPEDLQPLLRSFRPMIRSKVNVYKGKVKMIPDSAIESEFQLRFVDALRSYDPSKGSLGTYVYRYLDKAKRFIVENQNVGRIPENRVYKIKLYNQAKADLIEEGGVEPTVPEIAQRLGWKVAEAERMDSELRNDLTTQAFEEDPYSLNPSKSEEVLRLFKYELTGNERAVYEHLTGYGKPRLTSTGAIAKSLKMPDYQVSRLKNAIQKKLKRYIND